MHAFFFVAGKSSAFSSHVGSRRIVLTHASFGRYLQSILPNNKKHPGGAARTRDIGLSICEVVNTEAFETWILLLFAARCLSKRTGICICRQGESAYCCVSLTSSSSSPTCFCRPSFSRVRVFVILFSSRAFLGVLRVHDTCGRTRTCPWFVDACLSVPSCYWCFCLPMPPATGRVPPRGHPSVFEPGSHSRHGLPPCHDFQG